MYVKQDDYTGKWTVFTAFASPLHAFGKRVSFYEETKERDFLAAYSLGDEDLAESILASRAPYIQKASLNTTPPQRRPP